MSAARFDLNLLAIFDAVHARGSVTQAARHLNLTQSAVSHALARLRREFDDPLFVRSGNALVPTALARSLVGPVRAALGGLEGAIAAGTRFDPAATDRLFRIGLRQSMEVRFLSDLAVRVAADAPGLRLASVTFHRGDLARALAQGDLDLAIDVSSRAAAGLRSAQLQTDTLVVVARPGHPFADGGLDLAGYLAADHIVVSQRPTGMGAEDVALAALGRERRVALRCQHVAAAWDVVGRSDRLLTLPQAQAETLMPALALRILPLPVPVPPRTLNLYWHETAEDDVGNAWMRGIVRSLFRSA